MKNLDLCKRPTYRSWTSRLRAAENLNETVHYYFLGRVCSFASWQTLTGSLAIIFFDFRAKRADDRKNYGKLEF